MKNMLLMMNYNSVRGFQESLLSKVILLRNFEEERKKSSEEVKINFLLPGFFMHFRCAKNTSNIIMTIYLSLLVFV